MLCKNCGAPVDGKKFCVNCGTKVEYPEYVPAKEVNAAVNAPEASDTFVGEQAEFPVQPEYQQPAQPEYQQPAQPEYQQPAQPEYQQFTQPVYQQPVQPAYQNPYGYQPAAPQYQPQPQPPKKKNTGLVVTAVIACIVAVIAIGVAVLFATGMLGGEKDKDGDKAPETTVSEVVTQADATQIPTKPNNNQAPTAPSNNKPAESYVVGHSYSYLPISITELGYEKMIGVCTFSGDEFYVEADYGTNLYENGSFFISYTNEDLNYNVIIEDGYFSVYTEADGEIIDVTSEFEADEIEPLVATIELMGFDIDSAFDGMVGSTPTSYVYKGTANHSALGTVEVFDFKADGTSYTIWIDQDTGVTARLYEESEIVMEFSRAYVDNSITITDYSTY